MSTDPGCKVDRAIEAYGLGGADPSHESIDEGLLARWRGDAGHDEYGYRSLTDWFNKRLLKQVYDEHGRDTLGARVDNDYEALTGDDELLRAETVESLAADGIPAERVADDMVSWGTMRTHLRDCLDGRKDRRSERTDWERESVEMAREFARDKVEAALSSLGTKDRLAGVEDASVDVQVRLGCDRCPTRVPLEVALDRGYVCERHDRPQFEPGRAER